MPTWLVFAGLVTYVTGFGETDHNVTFDIREIPILSIEATMVLSC